MSCNAKFEGPCKVHAEPMVHISDSPILSYARASVPRVLELKPSQLNKNETGLNIEPVFIFFSCNDLGLSVVNKNVGEFGKIIYLLL